MYTTHHEMCLSLEAVVDSLLCCCLDCSVLVPTALEDGGQEGGEEGVCGGGERHTPHTLPHEHHSRNGPFPGREKIAAEVRIKKYYDYNHKTDNQTITTIFIVYNQQS